MLSPLEGVESLAAEVIRLRNDLSVRAMVENRVAEFLEVKERDSYAWFTELVYCLLTAYSSAERGQLCVDALCDCGALLNGSLGEVSETLRCQGHRFAERRAEYIVEARRIAPKLKKIVQGFRTIKSAREWLVKNVKGLGWKEASHFLRNVGYLDIAILDRHIMSNMRDYGLIPNEATKGLTKRRYLEYERLLEEVARRVGISPGEMDLYLWYRKTGKVLK
jgi:N-glycosylase/DNA lyase